MCVQVPQDSVKNPSLAWVALDFLHPVLFSFGPPARTLSRVWCTNITIMRVNTIFPNGHLPHKTMRTQKGGIFAVLLSNKVEGYITVSAQ